MPNYGPMTNYQILGLQREIMHQSWAQTKLLNFFRAHGAKPGGKSNTGLIKNVGRGTVKHTTTQWEKLKPGQISSGLQDLPDSHARLSTVDSTLAVLATKVVIPVEQRDAWSSNRLVGAGDMLSLTVSEQVLALTQQVDQFIANGDAMKTPLGNDVWNAQGKFTGLMNGFTRVRGGIDNDENMSAAGDYLTTFVDSVTELAAAGFEGPKYYIISDHGTRYGAETGNNLYTGLHPVTEWALVKEREDVMDWIFSVNVQNASSEKLMCVTQPFTSLGEPAYRLLTGYDFDVIPLYAGGIGPNMSYEMAVVWSGCIEELHAEAVQRTTSLTT